MILQVTTENGSVYRLDYDKRTWERLDETCLSGQVRTDSGPFTNVLLLSGFPMVIYGPPLDPEMEWREITTSPVTEIVPVDT